MSIDPEAFDESQQRFATTPQEIDHMPPGIPYIVGNEAAERFSFYGMKSVLAVFMTGYLVNEIGQPDYMSDEKAKEWVHNFVFAVYFFPIVGAFLSDWLTGKYRMIIALSLVYCAGHGVLACMDFSELTGVAPRNLLFMGLALIAIGSGGIKPCVSAHVGDQFGKKNHHLVSRVFGWFYFAINFGSTVSTLLIPFVLNRFGPGWAFGIPGILMAAATFLFWMGRHKYVHIQPSGNRFFKETFSRDGLRAMGNLIPLYIFIMMFWALFDQTASAWVLQAKNMDRTILGWNVLPSQLQAINPILVMILIPIFSYIVYPVMGKFFKVTPLKKIGIGLFLTVPSFCIPAFVENMIADGQTPGIIWHFWAYLLLTAAEVMVSITALEFSYTQAPKKMKSFVMGLYLLSVAFGNLFTAQVNSYIGAAKESGNTLLEGANYYWFFTIAMLITAVIYVIWSQFYRGQTYIQGEHPQE